MEPALPMKHTSTAYKKKKKNATTKFISRSLSVFRLYKSCFLFKFNGALVNNQKKNKKNKKGFWPTLYLSVNL